jgi:Mor family transcriptional regulator
VARPRSAAVSTRDGEIWSRWNAGERSLTVLAKDYGVTPQRIGQVIAAKDREVYAAWRTGKYTLADLADTYELTAEDVTRIVTARHPEQQDEATGRAVLRSRIELLTIAIQDVIENPGYKLAPNGRLAEDESGNPLVDVTTRVEAIKVQLNALKNLAVLNGDEKPARTHVSHEIADQERAASIAAITARIEADRRELEEARRATGGRPVVPGEVIREIEPTADR